MNTSGEHQVMTGPGWPVAPRNGVLPADEVHVFAAPLDVTAARVAELRAVLSADEIQRAARYSFEQGQRRFAVGRGLLREILGCYLAIPAGRLEFAYPANGKPELVGIGAGRGVHFNLAHSHGQVVYAISRDTPVGIDLEAIRPLSDLPELAATVLSAREHAEWQAGDAAQRSRAFFAAWARKEAYLKGTGQGLGRSLAEIEVPLQPCGPEELLPVFDRGERVSGWVLRSLSEGDFAIAVAHHNTSARLRCWRW